MATITSLKCNHHSKLKDAHQPPTYSKAQPQLSHNKKCKKSHHPKKFFMLNVASQDKQALEVSLRFFQWEEEEEGEEEEEEEEEDMVDESTSTSSKGKYDMEQPNDKTIESPLKKQKKNVRNCQLLGGFLLLQRHGLQR
jgi:hypothetical protein